MVTLAAVAALLANGSNAQGEAPKPAGSPSRPPVDFPPPPCSAPQDLMKLDALLGQWNDVYQHLQAAISAEVAASHEEGLAQSDDDRAKDEVSWTQTNILLLQTEIGVREKQLRGLEVSQTAPGQSGPLADKDYLADRVRLLSGLRNALAGLKGESASAQAALAKAQNARQKADDSLDLAQQKFAATAQDSRQASQTDRAAEDTFRRALQEQGARPCQAAQVGGNASRAPAPTPPPEPGSPPPAPTQPNLEPTPSPPATEPPAAESGPVPPSVGARSPIPPPPEPAQEAEATSPAAFEAAPAVVACSSSRLEADVLARINQARTGPVAFAKVLLPEFGGGSNSDAVKFLRAQTPVSPLVCDGRLEAAAHKQIADQGPLGGDSHIGSDGSEPWKRMQEAGVSATLYAEEISVTFPTALGTVSQLLIDPTPPVRKHAPPEPAAVHQARLDLMNANFQAVGVACGANKKYKVMCVIDLSSRPGTPLTGNETPP